MNQNADPFDPTGASPERGRLMAAADRLVEAGFIDAGWWVLDPYTSGLRLRLQDAATGVCPALYAFTVDGALAYVGKTVRPLRQRLQGYQSPAKDERSGASTNRENNARIVLALRRGQRVRILALSEAQARRHAGFMLDLPAALEGGLIAELSPPWNRQYKARTIEPAPVVPDPAVPFSRASERTPSKGFPMTPTASMLLDFARSKKGAVLRTLRRNTPFHVEVIGNAFEFLPTSGQARREGLASAEAVLKAFSAKPSWQMSDYQEMTFNASYLLALLKGWQDSNRPA